MNKKTYLNWSGGKDAAMALYKHRATGNAPVTKLLTTISQEQRRITMHGVAEALLDAQAEALGLPVQKVALPASENLEQYNKVMAEAMQQLKQEGFERAVFGDIFLEDLRKYREEQLEQQAIRGVFPLWKLNTKKLLQHFINLGFKAVVVCTNARLLGEEFVGKVIDQQWIDRLPDDVDPCGENGEFHTFVFDGPIFSAPIPIVIGENHLHHYPQKEGDTWDADYWFCELSLKNNP